MFSSASKIESLGGMVDVETVIDEGSKFKVRLPLTLAIIQALLVKISDEILHHPNLHQALQHYS